MTSKTTFLGDWASRAARAWGEREAVSDAGAEPCLRLTYTKLDARASSLAQWLRNEGVRAGDRVATLAFNAVSMLDVFFACAKVGAVFVPLNWRLQNAELAAYVQRVSPRWLFVDTAHHHAARDVVRSLTPAPALVGLDVGLADVQNVAPLLSRPESPLLRSAFDGETLACLLGTGGTTGTPKAACISHRMIAWNVLNTSLHELRSEDVVLVALPMFHAGGLLVYTLPLLAHGGRVVLMPRWDPTLALRLIETERVTLTLLVPTQLQELLRHPAFGTADLSSLRFVTTGGAPLPEEVKRRWRACSAIPLKQGFGMTEVGPGAFSMTAEESKAHPGAIGKPNFFVDAKILREDGTAEAHGTGELILRGPSCFSGYFGQPEATRDAFGPDGFFRTGDLARMDEDGFTYVVGRKKDMFISGGENVFPAEVESVLAEHGAVFQCAVVGIPDERWGEVGCAYVVLTSGATANVEELLTFARGRLASYKVPKRVVLVPELPLTAAGKIDRRELLQRALG